MTAKTYTIHGLPDLPEGYGPDLYYGILPKEGDPMCMNREGWFRVTGYVMSDIRDLHIVKPKPWYPDSWYDEHGNLLPDVYEHTPGTWPQHCEPGDTLDYLNKFERDHREFQTYPQRALGIEWDRETILAYRVIERA